MNEKDLKQNLKKLRTQLGLTQEEMGEKLGLNRNAYRALEAGPTHIISPHAYNMAALAQVSLESLLLGYEPAPLPEAALRETRQLQDELRTQRDVYEAELRRKDEVIASKDALLESKDHTIKVLEEMIAMLQQK